MSALLTLVGLRKSFGQHEAVAGIDLELRSGEILGLLGPNGAGKTTTLKLLLGMLRPTGGSASVLGFDCTASSIEVKRRVGYSPDEPAFHAFLSGRETIDFVLQMRGIERRNAWIGLEPLIQLLEFAPQLDALTSTYSHGMSKKLALLLALAHRPPLLLLDEPTNGLDPRAARALRELLLVKAREGAAVVVSTHLLEMADRLCSRVVILNQGRLVASGTPAQVRESAGVRRDSTLEEAFLRLLAA